MKEDKYKENYDWIRRAQEGEEEALEALVLHNAGLVNSIALKCVGRGVEMEDLVQMGNLGLIKAVRSFDFSKGCAFSTYAVPLIFGEIRRFLRDDGPVKVPRAQKRLGAMLAAEREKLLAEGSGEVPLSLLAERCGVSPADAAMALDAVSPVRSLSEVVYGEEDGPTLESTLADPDAEERELDRISLSIAIEKLPPLWRRIILLRYYRDLSQEKTARILGLTQVKVSREEKKILAHLRQVL